VLVPKERVRTSVTQKGDDFAASLRRKNGLMKRRIAIHINSVYGYVREEQPPDRIG